MNFSAPSKLSLSLKMTMLSLLMTSLLAGCGIRGQLKTPPPLFGGDAKVDPDRIPDEDLDDNDQNEDIFDELLNEDTLEDT